MHWMQRILSGGFACVISATSLSATVFAAESQSTAHPPVPSSLSVQRTGERAAVIAATFPDREPGSEVTIFIDHEPFVFSDTGKNGDREAGDGTFSIETEFDFDAFAEGNLQLREQVDERPLFAPGGRQLIGTQRTDFNGEEIIVIRNIGGNGQQFELPISAGQIGIGNPVAIPLFGGAIGAPQAAAAGAPASIPDSLMITKLSVVNDPTRTWACTTTGVPPAGNPVGEWTFWQLYGKHRQRYFFDLGLHKTPVQALDVHAGDQQLPRSGPSQCLPADNPGLGNPQRRPGRRVAAA